MTKITKSTFKSFIKKNAANLYVKHISSFDGMTDGVEAHKDAEFHPAVACDGQANYSLGINGLWLVGNSRDYFAAYEDENFVGIEVSNSCGRSIVATKKETK